MKRFLGLLFLFCFFGNSVQSKPVKYVLIYNNGQINEVDIKRLNEPLLAIAAYYSALGGSECTQDSSGTNWCDLTSALGLGNQGSERHLALLKNWFPDDKAAKQLIIQECYQRPAGASSFSNYQRFSLIQNGDVVTISYKLMLYSRGKVTYINAKDKIKISSKRLLVMKRSI